jgi:hypothetical protein
MAKRFLVRIELHKAKSDDYEDLHDSMGARFFERTLTVGGVRKKFPNGTYLGPAPTMADAMAIATSAAAEAGDRFTWSIVIAATDEGLGIENLDDDDTVS